MAITLRNFHVPLPDDVYQALREEASDRKQPATAVAREAIETWLREQKRAALREAIAAYAAEHAGTQTDLDTPLETAGLELLGRAKRRRRK